LIAVAFRNSLGETAKKVAYVFIAVPAVIGTLYLGGTTVYLNLNSLTGGPVHWHADYQVWACDKKLDLVNPGDFENFVGSPVVHEHGDSRIHIEGVPLSEEDIDLHSFFEATGGVLESDRIAFPTNNGSFIWKNGDLCAGKKGELQVFVYKVMGLDNPKPWTYVQEKLKSSDFGDYAISRSTNVPPGDCIIFEFGTEKNKTARICESWQIAIDKGEIVGQK
jgi:hypothetical protein